MLSHFFRQIFNSIGIFFRTIRAFLTRKMAGLVARVKRLFNFSRKATKVATEALQGAAAAIKEPTKREDYIETRRLFISKSFLIKLFIFLVAAGFVIYLVVWPFLLSTFFTAHFYQGEDRVKDWSGRVVVYYDVQKKQPMYEGRLEKGLLENEGMLYDENGLVTYRGSFQNGLPNGKGKAYENGVLIYDGSFENGLYEGPGELYRDGDLVYRGAFSQGRYEGIGELYENGELVYRGAFSAGLPNGMGVAYQNGVKVYEGSMVNGAYSGQGTLFSPDGQKAYVGSFLNGMKDGQGTAYREDGTVLYKGSFAEDRFDGDGVYYLEGSGGTIAASFVAGRTDGAISWFVDGKLWYEGSADDLTPDGFGTLYAKSGKPIYAGEMKKGTIDGAWLLGLSVEDLRAAFCEATLTETDNETGGFLIANQELGLTALCSYRQQDSEAAVCALWLTDEGTGTLASPIPWKSRADFGAWAAGLGSTVSAQDGFEEAAVPAFAGEYENARYVFGDWSVAALLTRGDGKIAGLRWDSARNVPAPLMEAAEDANAADARLNQLLESLKLIDGEKGKKGSKKPSGSDVGRLIALCGSAKDAETLIDTLLSYDLNKQTLLILEESTALLQQLIAEEQDAQKRGAGNEARLESLQSQMDAVDQRMAKAKADMEKAALTVQDMTLLDPADYGLEKLICSFDPAKLDAGKLYDAAITYAQNVAAGLYEVDADKLPVNVKAEVINLELAYQTLQSALNARQRASEAADKALKSYSKSAINRYELYQAKITEKEATIALYEALADFSRQANVLNGLSGGWISEKADWLKDVLPAIYQHEVNKGQAAAKAKEQEQIEKEQQAKEQLTEGNP